MIKAKKRDKKRRRNYSTSPQEAIGAVQGKYTPSDLAPVESAIPYADSAYAEGCISAMKTLEKSDCYS